MARKIPIYRSLPDPWRGRVGFRKGRRWVQAKVLQRQHNSRQPADAPTVNFYPMMPGPNSSLAHVLARLPVRIGNTPRDDELTIAWDTGTWFSPAAAKRLPANAVNRRCLDISKGTVDRIWAETAGYSITVDPRATHGQMVVKPQENGKHGGQVVDGPIDQPRSDMVYQRLVDARIADGRVEQLRLVVWSSRILFTYAKWRAYPNWFTGTELTLPSESREYISEAEERTVLSFADSIGIEYGELDVLRDRNSGLIYVVDANRTSVRPKGLPLDKETEAFAPQAEALAQLLADRCTPVSSNSAASSRTAW